VGADTSCGILIQITGSGDTILGDPNQGPFDGADDTLVGVLNSSSSTVTSIAIAADSPVFGFDDDGLCTASPQPSGCPFGPTGYEGPGTGFTGITPDQTAGVVTFTNGIPAGQSAYFSLEEALPASSVVVGGPSAAEQGGPANESENPTTCSTARPVNCATGVFWHQFTDFAIPGRGAGLTFTRTYSSSLAVTDGPLGFGWTDTYNMSLSADTSGNVTIDQEDGSTVTFTSNGSGGFTAPPRVLATLAQNPDGSYTFTRDRSQAQYTFSASGQLESIADLNGDTTTLSYTGGNLTSVTDPSGRQLTFTYTGPHIASATDPMGRAMSFSYDTNGNLVSTADAAGRTWAFTYDASHQMLTMTDPRGKTTTNTYNASNQVTAQTDPDGGTTTWSYSGDPTTSAGATTTMTDPDGNSTTYSYSNLELTSLTHGAGMPQAATTSYTYDPATLGVTSATDPNGNVTTSTYDSSGNLLSATDQLGDTTSYSYNSLNEVQTKTSPVGETTSYTYDSNGNLLSVTDPLGGTTSYTYGDTAHPGDITSVTDPDGNVTAYTYDTRGDLASARVSPSAGATDTTTYAYDADGERTCQASPKATAAGVTCPPAGSPPAADTTATAYNAAGEVTSVTNPDGHTASYAYDADGNLTRVTDPNGNVTSYTYNGDNQQTKITRPDGTAETSSYDANGNLIRQTNAASQATSYAYNALNRVISTTDPLGHTTSYSYDAAGNRTSLTDPSGAGTTYSYDPANELTGISYSDGTTPDVSFSYDADGQRVVMANGSGTTSYSYDADGRLTSSTNGAGASVSYAYDPAGHLTSLTYPNGDTVNRSYDGAGRLSAVTDWLGHTTSFNYDTNGNLTKQTYPNGVRAVSAYDNADQLTSITDRTGTTTLASLAYTRDNQVQVTSDAETGAVHGTNSYAYTPLSQLASSNGAPYTYDPAGDPTTLANGTTQTFNAASELTSSQLPTSPKAPATDKVVSSNQTSLGGKITSPGLTTKTDHELVVAFISATGPSTTTQKITKVSGGGLTWTLVSRADGQPGTAEVWQAHAATPLTNAKITATLAHTGHDGSITVAAFTGAGAVTGAHAAASGDNTHPHASLTTTRPDSLVWGAGEDATHATTLTPASGQTLVHKFKDSASHATYWAQKTTAITTTGSTVKLADTITATDRWNMAAVEITSASGTKTTYSYDNLGNRTSADPSKGPATTLTYDQANRLVCYGGIATYAYNGDGLRMSKTVNETTTTFAWDQSGTLPLLLAAGATAYIYGPGGQPIEQIHGSTATYLLADQQGSTRLLTNSTGAVVGTYSYTPYGVPTGHTGTAATALQYDGQYTDTESGLNYLRARYYDPSAGQFLSLDPMVSLTLTPYGYADDNPINELDPTGLSWWNPISWTAQTWSNVAGVAGLGLGVAAVVVAAPETFAVLTGLSLVAGGISAGIGLVESAQTCSKDGWGPTCSGAIMHTNLNTLFTAASARWLPDLRGIAGIAEQEWDYLAGVAVDKVGAEIFEHPQVKCG